MLFIEKSAFRVCTHPEWNKYLCCCYCLDKINHSYQRKSASGTQNQEHHSLHCTQRTRSKHSKSKGFLEIRKEDVVWEK